MNQATLTLWNQVNMKNHRFGSNRGGDLLCQGMEWMLFSNQKLLYETQDIRDRHCAVTVDIKLENS